MPQDPNQSSPNWRGGKDKIVRKVKTPEWKPQGQEIISTEGMGRKLRIAGYFLGVLFFVAVIVVLINLLIQPAAPILVVVANDPWDDALNPDVPLDFYGWNAANMLTDWIRAAKAAEPKGWFSDGSVPNLLNEERPYPLKDAKGLIDAIANRVKDKDQYVVVVFSMFGAVDEERKPFLYVTGNEKVQQKVYVHELLSQLKDNKHLDDKKTRVLLCFDAARLQYAPRLGIVHNDFVRQVKLLYKNNPSSQLAILCSSGENELAWNADQGGQTVFMKNLMEQWGTRNDGVLELNKLVDQVQKATNLWTTQRVLTPQTPVLLPEGGFKEWNYRYIKEPAYPTEKSPIDHTPALVAVHTQAKDLASKTPGPQVYLPTTWRYYRELLSRYEQALEANHDRCSAKIKTELDNVGKAILAHYALPARDSRGITLTMTQLLGKGVLPLTAEKQFEEQLTTLSNLPKDFKLDDGLKQQAIKVRELAEQAALAYSENTQATKAYPYSEKLWPLIWVPLQAADAVRRQAEDKLFTSDPKTQAEADKLFKDAQEKYQAILKDVADLQNAWAVYHRAASLLPELVEWRTRQSLIDSTYELAPWTNCCKAYHELEQALNPVNQKEFKQLAIWRDAVFTLTKTLETNLDERLAEYQTILSASKGNNAVLFQWEAATRVPMLIDVKNKKFANLDSLRREAINSARNYRKGIYGNEGSSKNPLAYDLKQAARRRLTLWLQLMGTKPSEWNDVKDKEVDALVKQAYESRKPWTSLEVLTQTTPETKLMEQEQDPLSRMVLRRVALGMGNVEEETPLLLRNQQWKALLHGQARRFALDHWYHDDKPFSAVLSKACIKDITEAIRDEKFKVDNELKAIWEMQPMEVKAAGKEALSWTTEPSQVVKYQLVNPPKELGDAFITTWAQLVGDTALSLKPEDTQAQAHSLKDELKATLELKDQATGTRYGNPNMNQYAFFRGQHPVSLVRISLDISPHRIVTWQKPQGPASFVVNSKDDLGIGMGHIVFLLDYSGSMTYIREKSKDKPFYLSVDDGWDKFPDQRAMTRMHKAIDSLGAILNELPHDAEVSVYYFKKDKDDESNSCKLMTHGFLSRDKNSISIGKESLASFLQKLKNIKPEQGTPLIKSMNHVMKVIGRDMATLVVLTDGMDDSEGQFADIDKDARVKATKKLSEKVNNEVVKTSAINMHMLFIEVDDEELGYAREVFNKPPTIGFHETKDVSQLGQQLINLLRPKVRLIKDKEIILDDIKVTDLKQTKLNGVAFSDPVKYVKDSDQPTQYRLSLTSRRKDDEVGQKIGFKPAEFMFLDLKPGDKQRGQDRSDFQFTRMLYYEAYQEDRKGSQNISYKLGNDSPWRVCVARNSHELIDGNNYRLLRVTLENDDDKNAAPNSPLLLNPPDKHTWWNVVWKGRDNQPVRKQPRCTVRRVSEPYFAPAWDILVQELDQKNTEVDSIWLQTIPSVDQNKPVPAINNLRENFTNGFAQHEGYEVSCYFKKDYRPYQARTNGLLPSKAGTPQPALVVQVKRPVGDTRPLSFEMTGMEPTLVEHLYFGDEKTGSITAYFAGIDQATFEKSNPKLKFITMVEKEKEAFEHKVDKGAMNIKIDDNSFKYQSTKEVQ